MLLDGPWARERRVLAVGDPRNLVGVLLWTLTETAWQLRAWVLAPRRVSFPLAAYVSLHKMRQQGVRSVVRVKVTWWRRLGCLPQGDEYP